MLVTSSADLAPGPHLATQAREPFPHYEHVELGFNYRLSNLLAALGRAQLRGLDRRIDRRRSIQARYRAALGDLPGITFMPVAAYGEPNWWLTCILVDPEAFGADREEIRLALEAADIESRPTWKPLHLQPVFAGAPTVGGVGCARGSSSTGCACPPGRPCPTASWPGGRESLAEPLNGVAGPRFGGPVGRRPRPRAVSRGEVGEGGGGGALRVS